MKDKLAPDIADRLEREADKIFDLTGSGDCAAPLRRTVAEIRRRISPEIYVHHLRKKMHGADR